MQAAHTTQYQKNKQARQKVGKRPKQTFFQRPQFSSVQFSLSVLSDSLRPHALQHSRPPCLSLTPGVYSDSCPLSWWCHPSISSSVVLFSSHLHLSQHEGLFKWVTSSHQVANESVLCIRWPKCWSFSFSISPSNEYSGLISLGWTGLISLLSKGLSSVLSNTTAQKHQFFGAQISL